MNSNDLARAAEILAAMAGPDALAILQFLYERDAQVDQLQDLATCRDILDGVRAMFDQRINYGGVVANVNELERVGILVRTGQTFGQPEPPYVLLNEEMPDLARLIIEALAPETPRPGDVALTPDGPVLPLMRQVTPSYPAVNVMSDQPIYLEVAERLIQIKAYGQYINRAHIHMFTNAMNDLITGQYTPASMRLYVQKWNAAKDNVQAPLYDFAVDLDYPEAPWNKAS